MIRINYLYFLFFLLGLILFSNEAHSQINLGNDPIKLDYTSPKKYKIGGIDIEGTKSLDNTTLIAITGLKIGDEITLPGDDAAIALRKLWDQGFIGDAEVRIKKIEGEYVFLIFELMERPRLSKFAFEGARKGEVDDIREQIRLIRGKIVTEALIANAKRKIENYFVEKGFLNAEVKVLQEDDTTVANTLVLKFIIEKGKRVKIEYIDFVGNEVFEDLDLRKKLKETKEKKIYRLFKKSKYTEDNLEADLDKVIAFYNKEGYRDAQIIRDSIVELPSGNIGLTINIYEGQKYYFRDINWKGNYVYSDQELENTLNIQKGEVYNKELLEQRLSFNPKGKDVSALYMDNGYLFFSVEPVEVMVEGDSIDIEMRVYEGEQATIKNVYITGNDRTNDNVILREIRTLPGEKFSRAELIRTQREIAQLGYFDPEQIGINPIPNVQDGTVDIEYSVVEKPSDQIELSGGWGDVFGFVGTVGLVFNNFSFKNISKPSTWNPVPTGDGQRVALRVQANGRRFQTYSLSFTEPWLGGRKPNSLSVSFSHSVQNRIDRSNEILGSLKVSGVSVGLGRRLRVPDDWFTLNNTVSYYNYALNNFVSIFNCASCDANSITFKTTLSRNSVSNPTYPRSGSDLSLSVSMTPPYSLFRSAEGNNFDNATEAYQFMEFHKWMFDNSWFMTVWGNLVLNTRVHFGLIGSYNSAVGIGPFERFSLGGSGLTGNFNAFLLGTDIVALRGYDDNSLSPTIIDDYGNQITGGIVFNKYVTELRYPISLNPTATIYGLTFIEAGNTWGSYSEFNPLKVYRSAGVGLRLFMPAFGGLIGIDYGYGLDKLNGQYPGGGFFFSLGQQIR